MVDAYYEEHRQKAIAEQPEVGPIWIGEEQTAMDVEPKVTTYSPPETSAPLEPLLPPALPPLPARLSPEPDPTANYDTTGKCYYCGKFGMISTFYGKAKRYCSLKCQRNAKSVKENFKKKPPKKRKKPFEFHPVKALKTEKRPDVVKSFQWSECLSEAGTSAARVTSFKHVPMHNCWENITVGIKVEVANDDCDLDQQVYWIASVVKLAGYNARLRYEGYGADDRRDFWMNLCSVDVHPVGWCAMLSKPLVPPQSILHKHIDWKEFLVKRLTGARTLPLNFYDKVQDAVANTQLRPRMRVEVVDKMWVSAMRVARVHEVHGGRCRLQYEASSYEDNDFWIHEKSPLVHYVGWSESVGHQIHASSEYRARSLKKHQTNEYHEWDATPDHFEEPSQMKPGAAFQVGMKLEAVDPLNLSAICPATVMKVLDKGYIMIGIDGQMAENGSDWFALHSTSPVIFPVGFCAKNDIAMTPPKDYEGTFSWAMYLDKTSSQPAPQVLFEKAIPKHGFVPGMKIEAVDLMEPRLLCVASVARVVGRLLRVHFDGWDSTFDQWVDCHSPDIYPVGWCEMVNYRLEGPPGEQPAEGETAIATAASIASTAANKKTKRPPFVGKRHKKRPKSSQLRDLPVVPPTTNLHSDIVLSEPAPPPSGPPATAPPLASGPPPTAIPLASAPPAVSPPPTDAL